MSFDLYVYFLTKIHTGILRVAFPELCLLGTNRHNDPVWDNMARGKSPLAGLLKL